MLALLTLHQIMLLLASQSTLVIDFKIEINGEPFYDHRPPPRPPNDFERYLTH